MNLVDDREVDIRRNFVLADALQLVWLHLRLSSGLEHFGENGSRRIGANDTNLRILFLEESRHTGDGPSRPDTNHDMRDLAFGLLPDFGACRLVMRLGIRRILVLVRVNTVCNLPAQSKRDRVVTSR